METERIFWQETSGWTYPAGRRLKADLVLYFGARSALESTERFQELRDAYPQARLLGCSTGGQIADSDVLDEGIAAIAIAFANTRLELVTSEIDPARESMAIGEDIAHRLIAAATDERPLAGAFLLSDGLHVNGSRLVNGLRQRLGDIPLVGGLAGDGDRFEKTLVGADASPRAGIVAAVGFYGTALRIGSGSAGGWSVFGPRRRVTKSSANTLFELDGEPALDLYERYLGEDDAKGLPGTALLFPLMLRDPSLPDHEVVRTVLSIDRAARSMTFAGDVPEGWTAQLMRGTFDRLTQGAAEAGCRANSPELRANTGFSLLISCIGRRLLMGQRVHEEVEAVLDALPSGIPAIGFYSYGEVGQHAVSRLCELQNQTMTVMTLREAA